MLNESLQVRLTFRMSAVFENTSLVFPSECGQLTKGFSEGGPPACTFTNVHPDGEVHWFHGSHNLTDGPIEHPTTKRVDQGGWLIIHSELEEWSISDVPYNCSLKSSKSGKYIASASAKVRTSKVIGRSPSSQPSEARSQQSMGTLLCISILLAVTLK